MINCDNCGRRNSVAPVCRAKLNATDGGLVEILLFACIECRRIFGELPKFSICKADKFSSATCVRGTKSCTVEHYE
jgi:hypothetical protein